MCTSIHITPCSNAKSVPEISLDSYSQPHSVAADPRISSYFCICWNKVRPLSVLPDSLTERAEDGPQSCLVAFWLVYVSWNTARPAHPALVPNPHAKSQSSADSSFPVISTMAFPPRFQKGLVFLVQFCFLYLKEPWAAQGEHRD